MHSRKFSTLFFTCDPDNGPDLGTVDSMPIKRVIRLGKAYDVQFDVPVGTVLQKERVEFLALTRPQLSALKGNYIACLQMRQIKGGRGWADVTFSPATKGYMEFIEYLIFPAGATLTVIRMPDDKQIEDITQEEWDKVISALENPPQEAPKKKKRRRSKKGG